MYTGIQKAQTPCSKQQERGSRACRQVAVGARFQGLEEHLSMPHMHKKTDCLAGWPAHKQAARKPPVLRLEHRTRRQDAKTRRSGCV